MTNWFYQLEGKEAEGPVSTARLKELAKDGILKPTDLIWKDGYEKWVKAKRLQGLEFKFLPTFPPLPDNRKNSSLSGKEKAPVNSDDKNSSTDASSKIDLNEFDLHLINDSKIQSTNLKSTNEPSLVKSSGPDFPPPLPNSSDDDPVWYFSKGKNQYGPVSASEILKLASIGQIKIDDMTWNRDLSSWIPFKDTSIFKSNLNLLSLKKGSRKPLDNVYGNEDVKTYVLKNKIKTNSSLSKNELKSSFDFSGIFAFVSNSAVILSIFLPWFSGKMESHSLGASFSASANYNFGIFVAGPGGLNLLIILFQLIIKNHVAKICLAVFSIIVFLSAASYSGYMGFALSLGAASSSVNIDGLGSGGFEMKNGPGPYVALAGCTLGFIAQLVSIFCYFNDKENSYSQKNTRNSQLLVNENSDTNQNKTIDFSDWSPEKLAKDKHDYTEKRIVAGILAIFLGAFGIHKFILGLKQAAAITLCGTLLCGPAACLLSFILLILFPVGMFLLFLPSIFQILGIIEGITYLTMDNDSFYQKYRIEQKQWL